MLLKLFLNTLLLALCGVPTQCYNILGIFLHPGKSHFDMFHPLMKALATKGHNVTVISHFPDKNAPPTYKDVPLDGFEEVSLNNGVDLAWFADQSLYLHYTEIFLLHEWGLDACERALTSKAVKHFMKTNKQKFDLVILEQFNSDCPVGIAYKFDAPFIALSSCAMMTYHYDRVGMPKITSYMPTLFSPHATKMTFKQRFYNWFVAHSHNFIYNMVTNPGINKILRRHFGDDMPDVAELVKKTSLIMVNQHFSLSAPKPLPPAVIEVGGIHIEEPKPLDPELQKWLDTADNGVILISWGSMIRADSLPDHKRDALMQALKQFKQRVIWKWENGTVPNKPSNVYIRSWLPQKDILCHPKVRVFMSHGGLLGSSEGAYCGVPMVVTPMYGDQFMNAAAIEYRGMGSIVKYTEMTTENIVNALKNALKPETAQNAKDVSYSYRNRQNPPLETAVWWAEYVAATGGANLIRSYAVEMPWYSYYALDIWSVIVSIVLLTTMTWVWILKRLCRRKKVVDSKKEQ